MPPVDVTILMPCFNEAETLAVCIRKASAAIDALGVSGEILVADNGSTDGSQAIAAANGARLLSVPTRGYGAALIAGIENAQGEYILMADADDSYDFSHLPRFVEALDAGHDLVMGNRFKGSILNHAMPPHHRNFGNPVLSFIGRLFFKVPIGDFHCGIRAFRAESIRNLNLRTTGMEFASEMVVKASLYHLSISEVPTTLQPDGRSRAPHLRSWHDGWRHLRFLLMFSPRWLFFYPGLALTLLGLLLSALLLPAARHIGVYSFDVDSLTYSLFILLIGVQITIFAVGAKVFGTREGFLPANPRFQSILETISLERGLIFGAALLLIGLGLGIYSVIQWHTAGFGNLNASRMLRITLPSATAVMLGVEVIFASFFLSLLQIRNR